MRFPLLLAGFQNVVSFIVSWFLKCFFLSVHNRYMIGNTLDMRRVPIPEPVPPPRECAN